MAQNLVLAKHVDHYRRRFKRSTKELVLNTAGGSRKVEWEIDLVVPGLGKKVSALVLPSTPDVLSLGKLIEEYGYSCKVNNSFDELNKLHRAAPRAASDKAVKFGEVLEKVDCEKGDEEIDLGLACPAFAWKNVPSKF